MSEYKYYIFDLDNTLKLHPIFSNTNYHENLYKYLSHLKNKNKYLFIASHNLRPMKFLNDWNLVDLFDKIVYEKKSVHPWIHSLSDYTPKTEMIKEIIHEYNIENINEIIFFDDNPDIINQVSKDLNINTILVDYKTGIDFTKLI